MEKQQIVQALQAICSQLQLPYHWELRATSRPVEGYAMRLIDTGEVFLGSRHEFRKMTDTIQLRAFLHRRLSHPQYPTIHLGLHVRSQNLTVTQIRERQADLAALLRWPTNQVCCYLVGTGRVVEAIGMEAERSWLLPGESIEVDYHLIHDLATEEGTGYQRNWVLIVPDHVGKERCWVDCRASYWSEAVFVPSLPDLLRPLEVHERKREH